MGWTWGAAAVAVLTAAWLSIPAVEHFTSAAEQSSCLMSYMRPVWTEVDGVARPPYRVFAYSEGQPLHTTRRAAPVVFLPGNAGSHSQGRSIASVVARETTSVQVYAVSFGEEFSAFSGELLHRQASFVEEVVDRITSLHSSDTVGVVSHSMGTLLPLLLKRPHRIAWLLALSAPYALPPLALDSVMEEVYRTIHSSPALLFPVLTISGGRKDPLVGAAAAAGDVVLRGAVHSLTTYEVPGLWSTCDHLSILWCAQLVSRVGAMIVAVSSMGNVTLSDMKDTLLGERFRSSPMMWGALPAGCPSPSPPGVYFLPASALAKSPRRYQAGLIPFPHIRVGKGHSKLPVKRTDIGGAWVVPPGDAGCLPVEAIHREFNVTRVEVGGMAELDGMQTAAPVTNITVRSFSSSLHYVVNVSQCGEYRPLLYMVTPGGARWVGGSNGRWDVVSTLSEGTTVLTLVLFHPSPCVATLRVHVDFQHSSALSLSQGSLWPAVVLTAPAGHLLLDTALHLVPSWHNVRSRPAVHCGTAVVLSLVLTALGYSATRHLLHSVGVYELPLAAVAPGDCGTGGLFAAVYGYGVLVLLGLVAKVMQLSGGPLLRSIIAAMAGTAVVVSGAGLTASAPALVLSTVGYIVSPTLVPSASRDARCIAGLIFSSTAIASTLAAAGRPISLITWLLHSDTFGPVAVPFSIALILDCIPPAGTALSSPPSSSPPVSPTVPSTLPSHAIPPTAVPPLSLPPLEIPQSAVPPTYIPPCAVPTSPQTSVAEQGGHDAVQGHLSTFVSITAAAAAAALCLAGAAVVFSRGSSLLTYRCIALLSFGQLADSVARFVHRQVASP